MSEPFITPVIAVDGGGTRCRTALFCAKDAFRPAFVVETGSANVSTDFNAATHEIMRGVNEVAARAGLDLSSLADVPAYLGLAGITGPEIANRLAGALPFLRVKVEDDRPAALRGVLGEVDGIVSHCGTGSFIAMQQKGVMRFVGGWGPVLGDPASAQWVGRQALARSLDVVDGLRPASALADQILTDLGNAPGVVRFAAGASPADFGRFAPKVTAHAGQGDALALSILQAGADEIAETLRALGWQAGTRLCLTGGIGPFYASYLPADMRADLADPLGLPLDGAMALAREFSAEIDPTFVPKDQTRGHDERC